VWQAVRAVVAEAAVAPGPPPEQAVQCGGAEAEQLGPHVFDDVERRRFGVDRFLEAGSGLAGWSG
jgi:hypothetical protein